jgi:hypothetical protein
VLSGQIRKVAPVFASLLAESSIFHADGSATQCCTLSRAGNDPDVLRHDVILKENDEEHAAATATYDDASRLDAMKSDKI